MSRLSLSMIVKDAEAQLRACLQSVRPLEPEIVIADTGSKDGTVAVAREFGARVIEIPWHNDFAEARNLALAAATGEWILSLDADEQLDATAAREFPALMNNTPIDGYQVTIRNYFRSATERIWDRPSKENDALLPAAAEFPVYSEHENIRLFRRAPEIYFVGRVHESVGPRIVARHGQVGRAGFAIHHFGFVLTEAEKAKKNSLYREMGREKLKENPGDWQAHFELGLVELEQYRNLIEARRLLAKACELNPSAGVAWFFLGLTIFRMGYFEDALNFLRHAEQAGHRTALTAETRGDAHYNLREFDEARSSYEAALKRGGGSGGVLAKLCLATVRGGKASKGVSRLREALELTPGRAELHEGLILSLVYLDKLEDAARAADEKLRLVEGLLPADYLRAGSLWAQVRNWTKAQRAVELGLLTYPEDTNLRRARGEIEASSRGMLETTGIQCVERK